MMKHLVVLLGVALLSGCLSNSAFGPGPDSYEVWVKPGVDDVTIWKDMLDCNYPEPFKSGHGYEGGERTIDQFVGSMICMEHLGYAYREGNKIMRVCETPGWRKRASCQPGANIPVPDTDRRLSSGYCKKYPASRACIP
ncbi:hypothetical protein [Stenotrophomonas sp.]|uniref:hypothetical protein n=1 Tax=Stenotrophomonas sp. TaxID=69392 RepID=UPI0028A6DF05|nr:hypothetical protein [Stenotrophomonas sp.]